MNEIGLSLKGDPHWLGNRHTEIKGSLSALVKEVDPFSTLFSLLSPIHYFLSLYLPSYIHSLFIWNGWSNKRFNSVHYLNVSWGCNDREIHLFANDVHYITIVYFIHSFKHCTEKFNWIRVACVIWFWVKLYKFLSDIYCDK